MNQSICRECGAPLINVSRCDEYFDRMIAWDFSDFTGVGQVHHLTVLCYYLQHPSHYSVEGLKNALEIFENVFEKSLSDEQIYQLESQTFSSAKRTWRVNGMGGDYGKYIPEIQWSMTVASVVADGIALYSQHVREWARAIYMDLQRARVFTSLT